MEAFADPDGFARHGDVELAYYVRGDGPQTVLLIMGIIHRAAFWRPRFVDALARHFRVVCFDNRGTGSSTKPVEDISAELWAGDALAVLDAVGVERCSVIGYSMGGRVAQQLMLDAPARLERVVLLASAIGGPDAVGPSERATRAFAPDPAKSPEAQRRDGLAAVSAVGFADRDPAAAEEFVALGAVLRTPIAVILKQVAVGATAVAGRLRGTDIPTLIIHGEEDPLVPYDNGLALHRAVPKAVFVALPGCGHLVAWEAERPLLDAVLPFLGGGEP